MSSRPKVDSWIIFYDDDSIYTSQDAEPIDVPIDGVQWILEFLEGGGKRNVHGMNYYRWTGDSWAGGNEADLRSWLRMRKEIPIILYGRWISDTSYNEIAERVEDCNGC